ncbi:Gfo/Idh/MocA family oxidoreductase [Streptomyces sp. NP160]|uniref:Gfo/Idh/MocA family protein n=1 Tax=Streptomyces sp. NP160 TaxID=2586637 RepID=UPI001119C268|nr:Gfo/Idh/MocA family oxidoreductase [Streptomyces sp. NP160]TNM67340.1 Gfo/Idh/MocA family oxidoreductase [Streptomyces sp. NP160]
MGLRVAVVGLSFGAEFVPIHQRHPDVASVVVCDSDPVALQQVGDRFSVPLPARTPSFEAVLADDDVDLVHLVTPFTLHAEQSVAALEAGKHVACTVPMGMSTEEVRRVVDAARASGRVFAMMETAVFTREFLLARALLEAGELGEVSLVRGAHYQDMTGWPPYWRGLPPMHYATHAVAPALALLRTRATSVRCLGSGRNPADEDAYGNPFPAEVAVFTLEGTDAVLEVTRSLQRTARPYTESFSVLGDRGGFEWPQLEGEPPLVFRMGQPEPSRGRPVTSERMEALDRADLLPPSIAPFTREHVHSGGEHLSFLQGGGHGGSHPHLVHDVVRAVVERRPPAAGPEVAADWTLAGLCAHASAMAGGIEVTIPSIG